MSAVYGFAFMGKRPEEISPLLMVEDGGRDIGFPAKAKITQAVPFSSEEYDFSEIYGAQVYGARTVKYVLHVLDLDKLDPVSMHRLKTQLINWLEDSHGRQVLRDDVIPDYHFLGEVRDAASLADAVETGELTVQFSCNPFMVSNKAEGDDNWDTFDFENDVAQNTEFTVDGALSATLFNPGVNALKPTIRVTGEIVAVIGQTQYTLTEGTNVGLMLSAGPNYVYFTGQGTVSFEFYREVI